MSMTYPIWYYRGWLLKDSLKSGTWNHSNIDVYSNIFHCGKSSFQQERNKSIFPLKWNWQNSKVNKPTQSKLNSQSTPEPAIKVITFQLSQELALEPQRTPWAVSSVMSACFMALSDSGESFTMKYQTPCFWVWKDWTRVPTSHPSKLRC